MLTLALALLVSASAQTPVTTVRGSAAFDACFDDPACGDAFSRHVGQSMLEQGFSLGYEPLNTSALIARHQGWGVGVQLATTPFGEARTNPAGKLENTELSPVVPRLILSRRGATLGVVQYGVGLSFLPPIPVKGAVPLSASGDISLAFNAAIARIGVEGLFNYSQVKAPIVATEAQVGTGDASTVGTVDDQLYAAACAEGCTDLFRSATGGIRVGASFWLPAGFSPYLKLGVNFVYHRLDVGFDDTVWRVQGTQPTGHIGLGWHLFKWVHLAGGASVALLSPENSVSRAAGFLVKVDAAASVHF